MHTGWAGDKGVVVSYRKTFESYFGVIYLATTTVQFRHSTAEPVRASVFFKPLMSLACKRAVDSSCCSSGGRSPCWNETARRSS